MPLKTFATKDEISEDARAGAVETKDGKWVVAEDEDVSDLQTAAATERTKREAAEKLVKKLTGENTSLQAKVKTLESSEPEAQKQALKERYEAGRKDALEEVAPKLSELETLSTQNRSLTFGASLKKLLGDAKFLPDYIEDVVKLHGDEFDFEDGKVVVKGKPGQDPKKLVAEIAKKRGDWVQGTKATGGGAGGTTAPPPSGGSAGLTAEELLKNPGRAFEVANAGAR